MSAYKAGDRVTVVSAGPENVGTEGRTGTVVDDGSLSGGDIAVKGYRAYAADQLRKA